MIINKLAILLVAGAFTVAACKKDKPDPPPPPVVTSSFGLLQTKILAKSCAFTGCHASGLDASYGQHGLILAGDVAEIYHSLTGHPVKNQDALVAGLSQVKAGDLDKSFFYQKLIFDQSKFKFGNAMPLGADLLTANQIEFVRQWILAGAPETGEVADKTLLD